MEGLSLSQLSSLINLEMLRCQHPPAKLAAFTALRDLVLASMARMGGAESSQQLDNAIPALQQLTCLRLEGDHIRLPATLSSTKLRMFYLHSRTEWEFAADEAEDQTQLPTGPWLQSLLWLAVPWAGLANSPDALAAAGQLEHVCITGVPQFGSTPEAKRCAFREWAAHHPSLRYISFDFKSHYVTMEGFDEALLLRDHCPSLKVFRHVPDQSPCFYFY
jgi:hypothetical protein